MDGRFQIVWIDTRARIEREKDYIRRRVKLEKLILETRAKEKGHGLSGNRGRGRDTEAGAKGKENEGA